MTAGCSAQSQFDGCSIDGRPSLNRVSGPDAGETARFRHPYRSGPGKDPDARWKLGSGTPPARYCAGGVPRPCRGLPYLTPSLY